MNQTLYPTELNFTDETIRFELTTFWEVTHISRIIINIGSSYWTRTSGTSVNSRMLYHLS